MTRRARSGNRRSRPRQQLEPALEDGLSELPEITDPSDSEPTATGYRPSQALLAAILRQTISDIAWERPQAKAGRSWVFGEDLGGDGWSFQAVCDHLGLDAERVRQAVRSLTVTARRESHATVDVEASPLEQAA